MKTYRDENVSRLGFNWTVQERIDSAVADGAEIVVNNYKTFDKCFSKLGFQYSRVVFVGRIKNFNVNFVWACYK